MRDDYSLHSVTFTPTTYRDESAFRHPSDSAKLKYKRWEVSSIFRDDDFIEGESHPEDEFIDRGDTVSFTEWCKVSEDFNPQKFLLKLIASFEAIAEENTSFNKEYRGLVRLVSNYGNDLNSTIIDDYAVESVTLFGKMYKLPTLNILPFTKARDRYWHQVYLFYSNCKLLTELFDPSHHANILGDLEEFKENKYEIIVDRLPLSCKIGAT